MDPALFLFTRSTPFSGAEGEQWDAWITRFEARTAQLTETEKLNILLGLLEGKALDVCAALSSDDQKTYSTVKDALEKRFSTQIDKLQAFSAFSQATRQPGENVQAFGERLRKLAQWTYQDQAETNEQVIQTVVNRFICGLQDTWLQRKLFVTRPKDLEAAVAAVEELHRQQDVVSSLTPGSGSVAASHMFLASNLGAQNADLTARGYSVKPSSQPHGYVQTASSTSAASTRPSPADRPVRGGPRCFGCGEVGHFRRSCPTGRPVQRAPRNQRSAWCLCCGKDGHWMAECSHYKNLNNHRHQSPDRAGPTPQVSSSSQMSGNW